MSLEIGGVIIAFLLFWAQLEPLFSTWFKKTPGWPTNAFERAEDVRAKQELENKMRELAFTRTSIQLCGFGREPTDAEDKRNDAGSTATDSVIRYVQGSITALPFTSEIQVWGIFAWSAWKNTSWMTSRRNPPEAS